MFETISDSVIPMNVIPMSSFEINTNDDPTLQTISLTLYVAGCIRHCKNCQNPQLKSVNKDNHRIVDLESVKELILSKKPLISSVCFCGGDFLPLYKSQLDALAGFCVYNGLKAILYTGEVYEDIDKEVRDKINIIIDGPYIEDLKNTPIRSYLIFPPSSNQRCWINGTLVDPASLSINKS